MGLSEKLVSIKNGIVALLNHANQTTGAGDTDLGTAVQTLIDGYGGGGGIRHKTGTITPTGSVASLTISEIGFRPFVVLVTPTNPSDISENVPLTWQWMGIDYPFRGYNGGQGRGACYRTSTSTSTIAGETTLNSYIQINDDSVVLKRQSSGYPIKAIELTYHFWG